MSLIKGIWYYFWVKRSVFNLVKVKFSGLMSLVSMIIKKVFIVCFLRMWKYIINLGWCVGEVKNDG